MWIQIEEHLNDKTHLINTNNCSDIEIARDKITFFLNYPNLFELRAEANLIQFRKGIELADDEFEVLKDYLEGRFEAYKVL